MSLILPTIGAFGYVPASGGSAPTYQDVSAAVSFTGAPDNVLVWPTHATNDVGVIFTLTRSADTPGTPTDWTEILAINNSTNKVNAYWKRAASAAESDVTVPDPGQYCITQMITIRGCVTGSTPVALLTTDNGASSTSFTIPSGTTTGANRLVLAYTSHSGDIATSDDLATGLTNTTLSGTTNRIHCHTSTGSGGGHYAATGTLASAGSTGTTTGTFTNAGVQTRAVFEFIGA